jgi:hypothetical protein
MTGFLRSMDQISPPASLQSLPDALASRFALRMAE